MNKIAIKNHYSGHLSDTRINYRIGIVSVFFFFFFSSLHAQTPKWQWAKGAGSNTADYADAITTDKNGNIYVTGYFWGDSITFGNTTLNNSWSLYIVKYDSSGNVLWAKNPKVWGKMIQLAYGHGIATDNNGNVYVTGEFNGDSIIFDTVTLHRRGGDDIYIVKYDALGNVLWAKNAACEQSESVSVTCDRFNNVYIAGYFHNNLTYGARTKRGYIVFDNITLYNNDTLDINTDMFVAKYDASGNVLWAKSVGASGNFDAEAYCVTADNNGNVYITGKFSGEIIFGNTTLNILGRMYDIFVVKYDASGNVLWAKSAGGNDWDAGTSIAITNCAVYVTGYTKSGFGAKITFDSIPLNESGMFIARYDPLSGNVLWVKGASGSKAGIDIVTDINGDIYITGNFSSSSVAFDSITLNNNNYIQGSYGNDDLFVTKYNASGNALWAKSAGGSGYDNGSSIATDNRGNLYVTGSFSDTTISFDALVLNNPTGTAYNNDIFTAKLHQDNFSVVPFVDSSLIITTTGSVFCQKDSATLTATAASNYLWSTGDTTQTINVKESGTYWVQANNGSCTNSASIDIVFASDYKVDLGSDTSTCNALHKLYAGNQGTSYLWSTGDSTQNINIDSSGTYWVQVKNGQCAASDTVKITFLSPPIVNLGNDTLICDTSYVLDAANTGAKYLWITGETNQTITVQVSATYEVQVSNNGCTSSDKIKITFLSPPIVNLGNDTAICNPISLDAGDSSATSYLWSTGDTTQNINVSNSNSYWVQVKNGQCTASDTITITFSSPTVNLGNDTTICGTSHILDAANPGATYLWSTGDTTKTITADTSENYWVKVQNGICSNTDTIKVTFVSPPVVDLGNDTALCEPFMLNAGNAGSSYQWSTGDTSKIIIANNSGIYWVKVSNGLCITNDSIKITFNSILVDLGNDVIACEEKTLDAGNTGARYVWSTGDTSQTITVSSEGTYWVKISNSNCTSSDTLIVTYNSLIVNLGEDIITCDSKLILDAKNQGKAYWWSTGDTTQTITITQDGNYWVRVAAGNCDDTDTITVSFIEEQAFLFTPNVFTPNNDTYNDVLDFSIENIEDYHLKIYNRWGELVFKTPDKNKSWDGTTTSGNEVPAGVYFWVLDYKSICGTGQIQNEKGFVHLIR